VVACTFHDQGTEADPACVHRCFTFVHVGGAPALVFGVIALVVLGLLTAKVNRRTRYAEGASWTLSRAGGSSGGEVRGNAHISPLRRCYPPWRRPRAQ
jgi:hypothetical protein